MRIGIDARMYGLEHAGIGRYIMNLIEHLAKIDTKNQYVLLVQSHVYRELALPQNFTLKEVSFRHYTVAEQLRLPKIIKEAACDLWHFPHFNVPVMSNAPFIVTIHDILWHQVKGTGVTTLPPWLYHLKYLGYRFVTAHAIQRSLAVIVPSIWVKNQIIKEFSDVKAAKIKVIYEAAEESLEKHGARGSIKKSVPYVVYTGSAYPHKNLRRVFHALAEFNRDQVKLRLVIISSRSVFLDVLKEYVKQQEWGSFISFAGFLSDKEMARTYSEALALVHPSLSEGFGLTGLEAMSVGLPVISSTSGSLPEVYGDAAVYFDPNDTNDLTQKLKLIVEDSALRQELIKKGKERAKQYSFAAMAAQTLDLYTSIFTRLNKKYRP